MLKIVYINNSFDPKKDRVIKEVEWQGKPLSFYTPPFSEPIVYVNQKRIEDMSFIPHDKSEIIFSPKQKIGAIAAGIYSFFTSGAAIATTWSTMTVGSALAYVAATAVVMAGSAILSAVLAPQMPNSAIESIEESPTYSWNPAKTMPRTGSPIPVLYGRHRLAGNIIQRRIEYVGDDEYLVLQLALCMGTIKDIYDGNIYINNAPLVDYDDVEWFYRKGELKQDVMPYFGDIETPNSFDITLEETPVIRETIGNANQAIRLFINFPNGLYYQNDRGGLDSREVELKIEYKKKEDDSWILLKQEDSRFSHYEYKCCSTCFRDTDGDNGSFYCCSPCEWKIDKKVWCCDDKRAIYDTKLYDTWKFSAAQTTAFSREIRINGLDQAQYEVRITRITAVSDDPRLQTTCHWVGMGEIIYDDLSYPTIALLGLRVKATGQLSGEVTVLTDVEREDVEVFDEKGVSQGFKRLDNPAWVFYDVLTNPLYGYGLSYERIDFNALNEWAKWCDELVPAQIENWLEPRYRFNGVFDFEGNIWDTLVKIATVGRASPIIRGTKYSVVVDKPSQMTQLFNMGNIVKSSLKITYISQEDLANEVEIQFTNKDKDYSNDTISVVVPEWFNTDLQTKKTTINQMGVTSFTQAYRVGRYFLNNNRNIRRTAEFDVGLDALDSEVGDVIGISHDVPAWGESGRLVSATDTTVTIDKEVFLSRDREYELTIRHNDNSFETFDITFDGDTATDTLSISGTFKTTPQKYDIYSLIEKPFGINLFRITTITRKNDFTRSVKAVEYNEDVVSDVPEVYPTPSKSELIVNPKIISIEFDEHLEKRADGTIVPYIDMQLKANEENASKYAIYYSADGGNSYKEIARDIASPSYSFMSLELMENKKYLFKAICRSAFGIYDSLSLATPFSYTFLGKKAPPNDVENFMVQQSGDTLHFSWDEISDVDKKGYEIREGVSWDSGIVIATNISHDSFDIPATMNGTYEYKIKAIDTSGVYSVNEASYVVTVVGVDEHLNYVINDSDSFDGSLLNFTLVDTTLYLTSSLTDTIVPNETDIFLSDYLGDVPLFCEYETNSIDTLLVGDTSIRINKEIEALLYSITDLQIIDRLDTDYPTDTDTSITANITTKTYISYSDDDISYSDWEEYKQVVNKTFRYLKIKVRFDFDIPNTRVNLKKLSYILDVPDTVLTISNLEIDSDGVDIAYADYNKQFYKETTVRATVLNGGANIAPDITSKTLNGFHIDLYDTSNTKVSGVADITIQGY